MKEFVTNLFNEYGTSAIMMIVIGLAIAFITEIAVKKTFEWLEKKLGQKNWMAVAKAVAIQAIVLVQVTIYTKLLVSALPFPGGKILFPVWFTLEYLIQYAWSLLGFGKFLDWIKNIFKKRAEAKAIKAEQKAIEEANKPKIVPVPGYKNLYRNELGELVDKDGNHV